jgi:GR25 family glycosyltransferase involved in LPS biosynthesis|tara:strand:- start:3748 stop:4365 length:618 start_codon:yes stop_codon:yes gene_type:complete
MKYETYILSLLTPERLEYINKTRKLFPSIKIFKSVNGYDKEETIKEFSNLNIDFHKLKIGPNNDFNNYGTLACWITKIKFLEFQVSNKIPHALFLEDDAKLLPGFFDALNDQMKNKWDRLEKEINIIRLFQWGEGYITSLSSAHRLLDIIHKTGVVDNIDNQFRERSGPELKLNFNNFYRKWVKTNEGDILKTEPLDKYFFDSIK